MIPIAVIAVIALAFGGYKLLADDDSEDSVASGSSSSDGEVEIEGSWSGGEATVFTTRATRSNRKVDEWLFQEEIQG